MKIHDFQQISETNNTITEKHLRSYSE